MTKTCARCAKELSIEEFRIRSRSPNPDKPQRASWCTPCHRRHSAETTKAEQQKYKAGELAPKWLAHADRRCARCETSKPMSEFYALRGRPDAYCKACHIKHYRGRGVTIKATHARKRSAKSRAVLAEIKATRGCEACGERAPVCLDFHHRDPGTKRFTISKMAGSLALPALLIEVEKCVVLCANCHRKQHHAERAARSAA